MSHRIIHVVDSFNRGGTQIALLALIERDFYKSADLSVIGLVRGTGSPMLEEFQERLGQGRAQILLDKPAVRGRDFPAFIQGLLRIFANERPDNVVLSIEASQIVGRLAALCFPSIHVTSFEHFSAKNGSLEAGFQALAVRLALRVTAFRSAMVFGDCAATLAARKGIYPSGTPSYVVPLSILDIAEARGAAVPDIFNILSVGRLAPEKNFAALIQAFAQLTQAGHKARLTIVGEGPQRPSLAALISQLRLDDKVFLAGTKSYAELAALRGKTHIYAQPSLHEGFCLATAEAMAAGLPVVATDFAGTRDYGCPDVNMIKIEGYDKDSIARALTMVVERYSALAPSLSAGAIATARERFTEHPVRARWEEAINALSSRPREKETRLSTAEQPQTVRSLSRGHSI